MLKRIFIYPKDVSTLTGLGIRKAQRLIQEIRFLLKKEKHQCLTVKEFSIHMGLSPAEIIPYLDI